jgi:uncharacterized coiled-coil protein SlyX
LFSSPDCADRFQDLSDTIRANNSALMAQKVKSQDMDGTDCRTSVVLTWTNHGCCGFLSAAIVRLEKQYTRGREIYLGIKNVVAGQRTVVAESQQKLDASKQKQDKLRKMIEGLHTSIQELNSTIASLRAGGTNEPRLSGTTANNVNDVAVAAETEASK